MGSQVLEPLVNRFESHSEFGTIPAAEVEELLESRQQVTVRWWSGLIAWESRLLWQLSWPSTSASLCGYMLSFVTLLFVGHLSTVELAGASLSALAFQGISNGIMVGLSTAVATLCGQAYGAESYAVMGIVCQRSIIIQLGAAFILTFLYWYSAPILKLVGHSESIAIIAEQGQIFSRGLVPQVYAYAIYNPMQRFLQAQNTVKPLAYISAGVLCLHILFTWLGIQVLGFGLLGSAIILSLSWWINVFCVGLYILLSPSCRETWTGLSGIVFRGFWSYFKFAVSSGVMMCLEVWYSNGVVLMSELLPNATISLDSISICINYWNWVTFFMLGILAATSVRVSNEVGAGHQKVAKLSVVVSNGTSIIISVLLGAIIMIFRIGLIKLSSDDSDVFEVTYTLMPLLAISVLLSGIHNSLLGVAIGNGQQTVGACITLVAYYLIGLPIAYVLGFKTSLGVTGLYWGLIIGLFLQTAMIAVLVVRTNWNAQVDKAQARFK